MKKALILTADTGFGHRAAANAIDEALRNDPVEPFDTKIVNLLDDSKTPKFLQNSQADFDKMVHQIPKVYEIYYKQTDTTGTVSTAAAGLITMLYVPYRNTVLEYNPDVIISTYPLYSAPATWWQIRREGLKSTEAAGIDVKLSMLHGSKKSNHIPFITVVTDLYAVHKIWFNVFIDSTCVATERLRKSAIDFGCAPQKVVVTGIPVKANPDAGKTKAEVREELGLDPKLPLVLAVGSKRVQTLMEHLNIINHAGWPVQIAMAAGGDDTLYDKMIKNEWHVPVKIYNYCTEINRLMAAADLIITKAGGLITGESLAAGLPMLLTEILPGQEEGNAQLVEESGAGKVVRTQYDTLEIFSHMMMNDGALLREMQANAARIGRPNAANDIRDLANKLISESYAE